MPNWCKGTLKVRGKEKNLKKFIVEALEPVDFLGEKTEEMKINYDGYFSAYSKRHCYIKGTCRGFVEDLDVELYGEDEDVRVLCLETETAWDIDAKPLQALCKEFTVDMKIYAFESGMEFNREIEIIDGEIVKDNEISFDDYEWDCVCPNIGG